LACYVTTRYLAHAILAQEKVVTCCVARVGQHVTTWTSRQVRHAAHCNARSTSASAALTH